ncbi:uncharacterized protein J7T54_008317 [Emericellopsis cladophorae]|uniref:F-box domain-containing protein n=1 Tax=Emericellopsis cladophorae TaxID=2686198 RepID=A0A9P9XUS2_9HYPO|nr:uncharacterized protein J7T54_008317 [Emericellopsis cladophorae]KAI6777983.1 hypothetical protein J7T54_008317 [Emericellopsis cladophorae]
MSLTTGSATLLSPPPLSAPHALQPRKLRRKASVLDGTHVVGAASKAMTSSLEHLSSELLSLICTLKSITWRFEGHGLQDDAGQWLPRAVLDTERMRQDGTELRIEGLPLRQFDCEAYRRAIPSDLLTSLTIASPTPPLTARLDAVKHLLVHAPHLRIFEYQDRGQGTQLAFGVGERMPPLRELSLRSYGWNHTPEQVRRHWDFSQLQSLVLTAVPYHNFLQSLDFTTLGRLRHLHIEDWSAHLPDKRREATRLLYGLVKHHLQDLRSLRITCHVGLFPVDALIRHGHSLEDVRFRDHVGFADDKRSCPTMRASDLTQIAERLPCLRRLEMDMDIQGPDSQRFLDALCLCPRLEEVILHVQTLITPCGESIPTHDVDRFASQRILNRLLSRQRPWKSITINVGGWRRVMVRRLDPLWREYNDMGIFAERCFVLSARDGRYEVREVRCIEAGSSRATPDIE